MVRHNGLYVLIAVVLHGCSTSRELNNTEMQAQRHMAIADTLERGSELRGATLEYQIVAERFPSASVYAKAVRKVALLVSSPENPAASDSASLYWLNRYLPLSQSPEEKQIIQMYLKTVGQRRVLRDSLVRQHALYDSLTAVTRKQSIEMTLRARRIQDLDTELQKASNELRKLKEVDERISKSRGKNK